MGTWVLNGTTVKLQDNNNTVAIGADTTPPGTKLFVTAPAARLPLQDQGGEVYNVKAYGAVGDGLALDRQPVQDAINAAEAAKLGIVYFPPGTYLINDNGGDPDNLLTFTQSVQFLGAGPFLSIITTDQTTKNIFHGTIKVTDLNDKVRPILFRDLKFQATADRTAGAAIRQDVAPGSVFEHGIRIENCHFKRQNIGVQLRGASTAVIENCTFWSSMEIASEADIWIDEQVGSDSTTHLVTGCLFADSKSNAINAVKITGGAGGDRIIGNLFVNYETQIRVQENGGTALLVHDNVMEGGRKAIIYMTGTDRQQHGIISGNAFRTLPGGPTDPTRRVVWVDLAGSGNYAHRMTVLGNKFAGGFGNNGTKAIEVNPTGGGTADQWLIAENLFDSFTTAVDLGPNVTGMMLGNNAWTNNANNFADASTGARGAAFLDRVGIGIVNSVTPTKELHVKSAAAARPRVYLEGLAGTSTPGIDFAFDSANTQRAAIAGRDVGAGVQLEFYTKPNSASAVARRAWFTHDGHFIPDTDNTYNLGVAVTQRWKDVFAVTKSSVLDTGWGSGRTLVPVLEGPEYLLYDTGTAEIGTDGGACVEMDPRFVELANTEMPYRVFASGCRVRARERTRFRLLGEPGDVVDWMVLAVRAGFENVRWRDATDPEPVGVQDPEGAVQKKSPENNLDEGRRGRRQWRGSGVTRDR